MKKITLLIASIAFVSQVGFAQSQRLVMFEEFTQASCPPCAATNPGLNALLNANSSKVVSVKYQTSWPGVDPMNAQNPTQVQTRVTYYNVTGVPDGHLDGNTGFNGQPAGLTQANINTRYATPSPFTIAVSHFLSATNDTVYAHALITCTQAASGTLVGQMAIIERNTYFTTPPGTNGETHFEGVMKKMLPSDQGTTLPSTWNVGDTLSLDYSWVLANVYDINQLAVVVWVQNNAATGKDVMQAGYSRPQIANDCGITSISGMSGVQCSTTINPVVNIHNFAINPLTSCTINYKIDAGTVQTANWTGNIASDGDGTFALPTLTLTSGGHTLTVYTSAPNGGTDLDVHNNQSAKTITVFSAAIPSPIAQNFASGTYPPAGWARENVDGDAYQWVRASQSSISGTGSSEMSFYNANAGTVDNLYAPIFDYSSASAGATLVFDVAHAQYGAAYIDELAVNVSTDCGATWTNVWDKQDPDLRTVTAYVTSSFAPTVSQWRHEVIDMSAFVGQASVLVQFKATSGYGNNVFVDNININNTVGINDPVSSQNISVYPNPNTGSFFVDVNFKQTEDMIVTITNPIGEVVKTFEAKNISSGKYPVDLSTEAKGNYFVNIKTSQGSITKRIAVTQ